MAIFHDAHEFMLMIFPCCYFLLTYVYYYINICYNTKDKWRRQTKNTDKNYPSIIKSANRCF